MRAIFNGRRKTYPVRDLDSTSYTGAIETAEEFGKRIYLEAWKRGWSRAEKKVVIGDGAEWIWNLAEQQFPGAVQIVDLSIPTFPLPRRWLFPFKITRGASAADRFAPAFRLILQ